MVTPYPRLPIGPLKTVVLRGFQGRNTWPDGDFRGWRTVDECWVSELAEGCGTTTRQMMRWMAEGGIPLPSVDGLCVTAGTHPATVYGDIYYAFWDVVDRRREAAREARAVAKAARNRAARAKRQEVPLAS
jgi:hypothetical protein